MIAVFGIKPRYAHAIVDGRKTIEVRRGRINASITSMVIYASKPERVVLGAVDVIKMEQLSVQDFRVFIHRDPIEADYLRYVEGAGRRPPAEQVSVLHLARPRRLPKPMPLEWFYPGVKAPQMWQGVEFLPPELV
jgi:predicted transcriptional regulator